MSYNQYNQGARRVAKFGLKAVQELPAFEGCRIDAIKSTGCTLITHRLHGQLARLCIRPTGAGGVAVSSWPLPARAYLLANSTALLLVVARWKQHHDVALAIRGGGSS